MRKQHKLLLFAIGLCIGLTVAVLSTHSTQAEKPPADTQANDVQLLARCVNGEARGETYVGQVAVAAVILNRIKHPSFPKSLSAVIYQPGAFTAVDDGQINVALETDSQVYKACEDATNGYDPTNGCIYYYNPATATNQWIFGRPVVTTIGKHKFAK
ncbi:MAG: cell wall hydrolase [Hyphomonadaceae bacterium]|nr:cell wall hydrolase [Clostridia bacterium]